MNCPNSAIFGEFSRMVTLYHTACINSPATYMYMVVSFHLGSQFLEQLLLPDQLLLLCATGLGYNEDLKTRTSFIEVLTSILQQGAEFNSLADTALGDRYNHMLDLVTKETAEGDFPIMMALVNSIPPENMVSRYICMTYTRVCKCLFY